MPGGFCLMFVVGILLVIHWDERIRFARVDKIALMIAAVAIVLFAASCLQVKYGAHNV